MLCQPLEDSLQRKEDFIKVLNCSILLTIKKEKSQSLIDLLYKLVYEVYIRYTVLSVNEYTPFEKYNFKQYLNEHKNHFQNVDKTKFNIISV